MTISEELQKVSTIFLDTAPIIYFIEAHPRFGSIAKEIVDSFRIGSTSVFTSVVTLAEVLSKPEESANHALADRFAEFLEHGRNLTLLEISAAIAKRAGKLRGQYHGLKTMDAIQIAAANEVEADIFVTNDKDLQRIKEVKVLVMMDYLRVAEP